MTAQPAHYTLPTTGRLKNELQLNNGEDFFRKTPTAPLVVPPYIIKADSTKWYQGGGSDAFARIESVAVRHYASDFGTTVETLIHWRDVFNALLTAEDNKHRCEVAGIVLSSGRRVAAVAERAAVWTAYPHNTNVPTMASRIIAISCPVTRTEYLSIVGAREWAESHRMREDAELFHMYGALPMIEFAAREIHHPLLDKARAAITPRNR